MKKQAGFTAIEVIIGVVLVAAIGVAVFLVYQNQQKSNTSKATPSPTAFMGPTPNPAQYLVIKEWGIKIKLRDAPKATYIYQASGSVPGVDSGITLKVKPEYLQDKTCNISVDINRYSKTPDNTQPEPAAKIGNYYYVVGGSPYHCNATDDALNDRIRNDFSQIEAL